MQEDGAVICKACADAALEERQDIDRGEAGLSRHWLDHVEGWNQPHPWCLARVKYDTGQVLIVTDQVRLGVCDCQHYEVTSR